MKPARASSPCGPVFICRSGGRWDSGACPSGFPAWPGFSCSASLLFFAAARPALAQSILRDSETELLFKKISDPLIEAAGLDPKSVKVVLINDPEINAFVAQGQVVYIHSGLLTAADNVNQLQGVIAHELGHVAGGHAIRIYEGARQATAISILSLVLGAAAIAAGRRRCRHGDFRRRPAGRDGLASWPSPGRRNRAPTWPAPPICRRPGSAARAASSSSRSCRTRNIASRSTPRTATTAPTRCRASASPSLNEIYQKDPAWNRPTDPALEARFQRVKAKLIGYVTPKEAVKFYPETDQSVPAHYARAYAYHLGAYPDKANAEADALLATAPDDPFFLELKGQILLEGGHPKEAIAPLRKAVAEAPDMPMIAVMLGHALIASEDPKNFAEAKQVLKTAVNRDNDNPFAWYQLGIVYDREGDEPARRAGNRRTKQPRRRGQAGPGQRPDGDGRPAAGNAGLSSRAGYRHGLRKCAEEGQEIP